jgi:CDP-glucose 4,6-dehydratase
MAHSTVTKLAASRAFWRGRRVLITGHTGFKGAWLALWLRRLDAVVGGVALAPETTPSLHEALGAGRVEAEWLIDIREPEAVAGALRDFAPEVVLHLAAQSLVFRGYREPVATFATNVMGTAHVLEAARNAGSVRAVVVVTSDKVYANEEYGLAFAEDAPLGGHDAYAASKAACEILSHAWDASFLRTAGIRLATARAGNVIGGGDWAANRLLPDAARAWSQGEVLTLRRPDAVRPWQHVLEPLWGYLVLAQALAEGQDMHSRYNFGPAADAQATVGEVVAMAQSAWPGASVRIDPPADAPAESGLLRLDASRAATDLGVLPRWSLHEAVTRTMDWYRGHAAGDAALALCERDIADYEALLAGESA